MKIFAAYISSEAGDHKLISFHRNQKPKGDKEWLPVLKENFTEDELGEDGPGIGGTWWYIEACIEVYV